tara:strand:- start:42 stop:539 length:498 start_codon:yes stop_codon:yes gene_type:complete
MTSRLLVDKIEGKASSGTVQMPAGHIVQVQRTYTANASAIASSSSSLAASGIQCSITPKFSNSLIIVDFNSTMSDCGSAGMDGLMYLKIGSASIASMPSASTYHIGYQTSGHNRYAPFCFGGSYTATSTSTLMFEPYFKSHSNGTNVNFIHPNSSFSLTATEIAQ